MGVREDLIKQQKQERLGLVNYNFYGNKMTIIEYFGVRKIIVQFDDGYVTETSFDNFEKGIVKNPYDRSVYGVGYFGEGKYKAKINGKITKEYDKWVDMMKRCYSDKFHKRNPTYIGCTIDEKWHNFQVFGDWFQDNYYEIEGQLMCLDKDILHKGNKVYSEENCVICPNNINVLFNKHGAKRGKNPIGVTTSKNSNRFIAKYSDGHGKSIDLGRFDTAEQAFLAYKKKKEQYIKEVADKYKSQIPENLYNALYSYQVQITD